MNFIQTQRKTHFCPGVILFTSYLCPVFKGGAHNG